MTSYRQRITTVAPPTLQKQLEVLAAARALLGQADQAARWRREEIAALRREYGELVLMAQELWRQYDPRLRSHVIRYNPDQPRVPAGSPRGGEWTSGGGGGSQSDTRGAPAATAPPGSQRGRQYAALDSGTRTDASGRKGPILSDDIPADDPKHPVPFLDSDHNPIMDDKGNQLVRPADLPPETYVRAGRLSTLGAVIAGGNQIEGSEPAPLAGLPVAIITALVPFRQGGSLDAERVEGQYVTDYHEYANIAIGLYMAAAGVDIDDALSIADAYASIFSHFHETMDDVYVHLPQRDVKDIRQGYELYNSGRISAER